MIAVIGEVRVFFCFIRIMDRIVNVIIRLVPLGESAVLVA